ncbi:MAG: cytochrome c oxidase subunit 3 [Bacteriovoracaceae bacterium]|nr:cytochrome c oxidase subunit 3 [Bacteriovoracaceae bacterium]
MRVATKNEIQSSLAMTVGLISFSMLFATLFMGYAWYRADSLIWPPQGMQKISPLLPTLSTLFIILSSFCLWKSRISFYKKKEQTAKIFYSATWIFALSFIFSQNFLWQHLKKLGIYASSGIFGSLLYGFTWIHMGHIALGLLGLLSLIFLLFKSQEPNVSSSRFLNVEKFWHFLGLVWVLMYVGLFLF